MKKYHIPVLAKEVVQLFNIQSHDKILDLTVGAGGHAKLFLEKLTHASQYLGIDQDTTALVIASETLSRYENVQLVHGRASEFQAICVAYKFEPTIIFADIGFSSMQIDTPERGMSFRFDGPLDMRMDSSRGQTVAEYIAKASEKELIETLTTYGEIEYVAAKNIAQCITDCRIHTPIKTTYNLVRLLKNKQKQHQKKHIQKLFQALRIKINNELGELERILESSFCVLSPGGKLGVISFHSLEDRLVKKFFKTTKTRNENKYFKPIKPYPAKASDAELLMNSRSSCAVFRVAQIVE